MTKTELKAIMAAIISTRLIPPSGNMAEYESPEWDKSECGVHGIASDALWLALTILEQVKKE